MGGAYQGQAAAEAHHKTARARSTALIYHDEFVEGVELDTIEARWRLAVLQRERMAHRQEVEPLLTHPSINVSRNLLGLVPLVHVGHDVLVHKLPHCSSQLYM